MTLNYITYIKSSHHNFEVVVSECEQTLLILTKMQHLMIITPNNGHKKIVFSTK